jgi:hypothetical protein
MQLQIQKNGKLLYLPKVLESSGSKTLDKSCRRCHSRRGALRQVARFVSRTYRVTFEILLQHAAIRS